MRVQNLALLSWLRICCKLWSRSQMWLRYGIAVAVAWASAASPIQPLAQEETAICHRCGLKKKKKDQAITHLPLFFALGMQVTALSLSHSLIHSLVQQLRRREEQAMCLERQVQLKSKDLG